MNSKIGNIKRQQFIVRAFDALWVLERALEIAQKTPNDNLQISVLGKVGNECLNGERRVLGAKKALKKYCQGILGKQSDFGWFCNPEIGTLFVAGSMTAIFTHLIDGKTLGAMSSGPYGILRGLGIGEEAVLDHIKKLNKGDFLLVVRGFRSDIDRLAGQFDQLEQTG